MIKKVSLVSCIVALALVAWLLPADRVAQAEPGAGQWTVMPTPSTEGNVIATPSEVTDFVITSNGRTMYAIDQAYRRFLQSTDGGFTWHDLTQNLSKAGAAMPPTHLAVAPDDPMVVAVVDKGTRVYLTTDGGVSFTKTGNLPYVPPDIIQGIAISSAYRPNVRDIVVAAAVLKDGKSHGMVLRLTLAGSSFKWQDLTGPEFQNWVDADITSVAFSPNYSDDWTILAVASTTEVSSIYALMLEAEPFIWNDATIFPGYPLAISGSPGEGAMVSSRLALPSDYNSRQSSQCQFYAAWNSQGGNPDVYRIDKDAATRLKVNGGQDAPIASLAYYGTVASGKLLAGEVGGDVDTALARVHFTQDPQAAQVTWQTPAKPPTGASGNARVSWSPDGKTAYCGTASYPGKAYDESAFSRSLDDSTTWNQLSLIDTDLNTITSTFQDITSATNASTTYLVSTSTKGFDSVWRTTTEDNKWQRVNCFATQTDTAILRVSPTDPSGKLFYLTETNKAVSGAVSIYSSADYGQTWEKFTVPTPIIDLALDSQGNLFAVNSSGLVFSSADGGKTWSKPVDSRAGNACMLSIAPGGYILVGGLDNGRVSYSPDNGVNFLSIPIGIGGRRGSVHVVADRDFAANKTIYAASDTPGEGVYSWVIDASADWTQIKLVENYQQVTGLIEYWGILYAAYCWNQPPPLPPYASLLPPSSGLLRCTDPKTPQPVWDELTRGIPQWEPPPPTEDKPPLQPQFSRLPKSLKTADGVNLWTIDTARVQGPEILLQTNLVYTYTDEQAAKPPPSAPQPSAPPPPEAPPEEGGGCGAGAAMPLGLVAVTLAAINWRRL